MEITKEQLIQFATERKELAAQFMALPHAPEAAKKDFAIAEIALAVLTAEPMGWMDELTDNPAVLVAIPQRLMPEGKNNGGEA